MFYGAGAKWVYFVGVLYIISFEIHDRIEKVMSPIPRPFAKGANPINLLSFVPLSDVT